MEQFFRLQSSTQRHLSRRILREIAFAFYETHEYINNPHTKRGLQLFPAKGRLVTTAG